MTKTVRLIAAASLIALATGCARTSDDRIVLAGAKPAQSQDEAAPLPPPPPPPPSPPPSPVIGAPALAEQSIKVTASTRTSAPNYYVPPVMIAQDPGRERYDGEEVSPVRLVQQEPVSTFSVDVDTGAYANTRRFLTLGQKPPRDAVRTEELINYFRYDYAAPKDRSQPFTVTSDMALTPWNPTT